MHLENVTFILEKMTYNNEIVQTRTVSSATVSIDIDESAKTFPTRQRISRVVSARMFTLNLQHNPTELNAF